MPPKWSKAATYWLVAALGILVLNGFLASAKGQDTVQVIEKDSLASFGQTICDSTGKPQILLRKGIPREDAVSIIRHELVHVRQIKNHLGGCRAAMYHYLTDGFYRFDAELEAYTVQLAGDPFSDQRKKETLELLATFMWKNYAARMPLEDIRQYVFARFEEVQHAKAIATADRAAAYPDGLSVQRKPP